jgi:hypothetical protein
LARKQLHEFQCQNGSISRFGTSVPRRDRRAGRESAKVNQTPNLSSGGEKERRVQRIIIQVLALLGLPLFFACMLIYKVAFSWWLTPILARRHQKSFIEKVRTRLAFLFREYAAEIVPNERTRIRPGWYFAMATIKLDSLTLRILQKNGRLTVHVAPSFAPIDWNELEATLCAVGAHENGGRCSYVGFYDLEKLLRQSLPLITSTFQKENYEYFKKLIDNIEIPKKKLQNSYLDWLAGRSPSATWHP